MEKNIFYHCFFFFKEPTNEFGLAPATLPTEVDLEEEEIKIEDVAVEMGTEQIVQPTEDSTEDPTSGKI